jgi:hypothetical protein
MIRKFAVVPGISAARAALMITILAGTATLGAQTAPASSQPTQTQDQQGQAQQGQSQQNQAQQPPENTQSGSQEVELPAHKPKPKAYKNWNFNAGGGGSLTSGTTTKFARGGGVVAAGAARNFSQYFGFRLDVQWDNLPLRSSALEAAQAPGATSHVYSAMLDPIFNIPVNKQWSGYIVVGPSFYHRSGKLDSSTAEPGTACDTFFQWWGSCYNGAIPINSDFLHASQNEWGENFGAGITRRLNARFELYGEVRYLHGAHGGLTTDLRPITIGLRW